ncbi:MAG TPA: potassium-transporting ATPase subunit KdpC [Rhizomicrobium sp.]|nr:potassium-transporting ATPase subunit KdpC [Rhizomicrobium sp.]
MQHVRPAIMMILVMTLVTGLLYPLGFTALAAAIFPHQAAGSLVTMDGKVIGSELIGQQFTSDKYFHGRPSAAGNGYDAANSSGSNYSPTAKKLKDRIAADAAKLRGENPAMPVPDDLVTASASGLDPDITPAGAIFQVPRIAEARHLSQKQVSALVGSQIEARLFGILGESHVNVLKLNLALDALAAGEQSGAEWHKLPAG